MIAHKIGNAVVSDINGDLVFTAGVASLPSGPHILNVDVTLAGSGKDIYELDGIHTSAMKRYDINISP